MTDHPTDCLTTPCGEITVTDGAGRRLPFSLRENPYSPVYRLFCGTYREEALRPAGNRLLCIPTGALTVGQTYALRLRGCPLRFGSSDEHTEAISGTARGYSIAIGAYDPNDEEKIRQAVQNCEAGAAASYDESGFVRYALAPLPDGFSFRLIDHSAPEVVFAVAWIKNGRSAPEDYEAAVEFWTT